MIHFAFFLHSISNDRALPSPPSPPPKKSKQIYHKCQLQSLFQLTVTPEKLVPRRALVSATDKDLFPYGTLSKRVVGES